MSLKEYIRARLPDYILTNDSYKDVNSKGFVERYLEIMGEELDEEYYSTIDLIIEQNNPIKTLAPYLDYIATALGDLPNISLNTGHYRNLLSFIVSIWQIKGTIASYRVGFLALGLTNTSVNEIVPEDIVYDDPTVFYDEPFEYDFNCQPCSDYDISTSGPTLTADLYQKIFLVISLLEPINARFKNLTYNGNPVTPLTITVFIDGNGDLIYNNVNDPSLVLTLDSNGDLIISGPQANRYYVDTNGDLIYLQY